jgi:hypothetical protein
MVKAPGAGSLRMAPSADGLTVEQLYWLLDGIDIETIHRHPSRIYQKVC